MKLAAHQPNLVPWFPFFYKMKRADVFILMINCQFEKNGFQNRALVKGKWWTLPVMGGNELIKNKSYLNGTTLVDVNIPLILGFARLLGIDTRKVHFDFETDQAGTDRLIELCKRFDCNEYLTNPEAMDKYLDEKLMNKHGIEVIPCDVPNQYKKSLFEILDENGIEGASKIINKEFKLKGAIE